MGENGAARETPEEVAGQAAPIGRISVVAPMRDEGCDNISAFIEDVAAQDFPGELEVLVADGGNCDREHLSAAVERHGLTLRVIDNPAGWVSPGLNACIAVATGDLIVRLDCHSRYPTDYLRRCAELAESSGAWNVGGRLVPRGETPFEQAVATAMDSPFGGIGWTRMADSDEPVEVDTVTFGAFRPDAFEVAGLFDEELVRNQDDEFNLRLRKVGGRIVLDPSIVVNYRPRGSLQAVWRQYFGYGFWKIPVMRKHGQVLTLRSLAPLVLVLSVAVLLGGAPASALARRLLAAEVATYLSFALLFGVEGVRRRSEPLRQIPGVMATFPAFHLGYGTGMASSLWRVLRARLSAWRRGQEAPAADVATR
jgi:succinoglycan biosynthesis protein ExoA